MSVYVCFEDIDRAKIEQIFKMSKPHDSKYVVRIYF